MINIGVDAGRLVVTVKQGRGAIMHHGFFYDYRPI